MSTKILSVDDSRTIRMIVRRAFGPFDCVVFEAANGEEGLAAAAKNKPDLIVLDITMPVMDGVTMLTSMLQVPELSRIPVIMLTAESGLENVAKITSLGAKDYLAKPFKDQQLVEKAKAIIELRPKPQVACA